MFSSINSRAIVPVACAVTGFVIACCVLLYTFVKSDLITGEIHHAADLADTVIKSTRYAMLHDDRETLSQIIHNIGDQKQVEHVRIFNKKGLIMFSRDNSEVDKFIDKTAAGCNECHAESKPKRKLGAMEQARQFTNNDGHDVLAITAPIYNEPECSNAACHFHDAGQSLLGTLDIGVSQAPLKKTLTQLKGRMIMFSGMVLVLTVGAVCALLYRQVFLPIKQLVDFTERAPDDSLNSDFPEVSGEVAKLANAFQKMTARVKELEERHPQSKEAPSKDPLP
ncbi:MAG: HAMP domain-containing protein [Deltaproteobacteria bacterium]|jgi:methyl-accepting chemotaxis protein|nr:HAMP domain-containing protein [Deltaproteobacteria bacterium]MDH4006574.1 HAMP domain-containing protein [Desulfuromonadales bacterium]